MLSTIETLSIVQKEKDAKENQMALNGLRTLLRSGEIQYGRGKNEAPRRAREVVINLANHEPGTKEYFNDVTELGVLFVEREIEVLSPDVADEVGPYLQSFGKLAVYEHHEIETLGVAA